MTNAIENENVTNENENENGIEIEIEIENSSLQGRRIETWVAFYS